MAPITFYLRESAEWLHAALADKRVDDATLRAALSPEAIAVRGALQARGACFGTDLQRLCTLTRAQVQSALWELATAGLAAADGFDQLRCMMDPRRKQQAEVAAKPARAAVRSTAGRWSLFAEDRAREMSVPERARLEEERLESAARMLLQRYGVLFRDLLTRETNAPRWRDLLRILRRLEARGDVRGGRFVTGFSGEQFALPDAVESLRATRHVRDDAVVSLAACDPVNLIGVVVPGERTAAMAGRRVYLRNGAPCDEHGAPLDATATPEGIRRSTRPAAGANDAGSSGVARPPADEESQRPLFA